MNSISKWKFNNVLSCIGFKNSNLPKANFPNFIKSISKCRLNNIYDSLEKEVTELEPHFLKNSGNEVFYKKATPFIDTIKYPFIKLPKVLLTSFANKFNIESLKNSKMLRDFELSQKQERIQRALRGLIKNGDEFTDKTLDEIISESNGLDKNSLINQLLNNGCNCEKNQNICNKTLDKFYKLFDDNLAPDTAKYHTPHERTIARLASGGTAAFMLGTDFYNKSILNGKSDDVAKEELKGKRKQELISTIMEAMSQYMMLGAFSSFTNNSKWGAPIVNTLLGIFFHIASRLSTKRSLTRIKAPNNIQYQTPSIDNYADAIKFSNTDKLKSKPVIKEDREDNKKHILSAKNIGLICLASIGIGLSTRGIKSTKAFEGLKNAILDKFKINELISKFNKATVGEVWVNEKELNEFIDVLKQTGQQSGLAKYIRNSIKKGVFQNNQKVLLGEYEKMVKLPILGEASKKELLTLPLAPFRLAKEILGYPYKIASKILEGIGVLKKSKAPEKLKNNFNILNTFRKYQQLLKENNNVVDDKLINKFKEILENNQLKALDCETTSKVNNAAIGQTTQLLGTFGSIYFAMCDDYNVTMKQTGDKKKANKDARLRGVNKIIRMATQIVCMRLNHIFKIPYHQSVLNAGIITVACTILTDSISRTLSGMPFKKMNKQELEEYNNRKKQGILKGYYSALDKLTD